MAATSRAGSTGLPVWRAIVPANGFAERRTFGREALDGGHDDCRAVRHAAATPYGFEPANAARICEPALQRIIRRGLRLELTDRAAAAQIWAQADRWITDDGAIVPLVNPRRVVATSRRLGGWRGGSATGLQSNFWVR